MNKAIIQVYCDGKGPLRIKPKNHRDGNYSSKLHSSFGTGKLKSVIARDLLRVGQAAFLADRAFRRGDKLGQQTRQLTVSLPVEEPKRWIGIQDYVANVADFVSQDRWRFEFTQLRKQPHRESWFELPRQEASIHLFSSGLDSLCGAAAAFRRGETPIFVTHSPPGVERVMGRIRALQEIIGFTKVNPLFVNFNFRASDRDAQGRRNMFPERSRRTRPMLFLTMAGAVALELSVPRIYLNENGVLAINLPYQSNLHGPRISRHAHPETLRRFEDLLRALWPFESRPSVRNPFSDLTKAEEIRYLGKARRLAEETITCEYAGQQMAILINWLKKNNRAHTKARECGLCMPCLVRRSALEIAGVVESKGHYVFDARRAFKNPNVYRSAPLFRVVQHNPETLYKFSKRITKMKPSEFAVSFIYELSLLPQSMVNVTETTRSAYQLYRRFARQLSRYLAG